MAAQSPQPAPRDPSRRRTRLALVVAGLVAVATAVGFQLEASHIMHLHERRVLAGDYQHLRLVSAPTVVDGEGKVDTGRPTKVLRVVASLRLTPPGAYNAVLMADDGDPKHLEKAEMVIAARDAQGAWHPASAAALVARAATEH